jgi:type IV secretory pathway TrbD component
MKVVRQTPQAISKPMLIIGIDWRVFVGIVIVSFAVAWKLSWILGAGLCLAASSAAILITRKDPEYLQIALVAIRFKPALDPIRREVFKHVED